MMIPEPLPDVRQLLAFYLETGVDCALADEPINRLVEPEAAPAPAAAVARPAAASPAIPAHPADARSWC